MTLIKDGVADFEGAPIVWQTKEVRVLVRKGGIFGACSFQKRD